MKKTATSLGLNLSTDRYMDIWNTKQIQIVILCLPLIYSLRTDVLDDTCLLVELI